MYMCFKSLNCECTHTHVHYQVLSTSVANAFQYFGDPETKETETFVRQFDRFFDCMNVRNYSEGYQKRKEYLKPYTSPDDSRLQVIYIVPQFTCADLHPPVA